MEATNTTEGQSANSDVNPADFLAGAPSTPAADVQRIGTLPKEMAGFKPPQGTSPFLEVQRADGVKELTYVGDAAAKQDDPAKPFIDEITRAMKERQELEAGRIRVPIQGRDVSALIAALQKLPADTQLNTLVAVIHDKETKRLQLETRPAASH